jgi:hypothetical protein
VEGSEAVCANAPAKKTRQAAPARNRVALAMIFLPGGVAPTGYATDLLRIPAVRGKVIDPD